MKAVTVRQVIPIVITWSNVDDEDKKRNQEKYKQKEEMVGMMETWIDELMITDPEEHPSLR